jgi:mannose-6-phosphate isomerase-like protein (cupin superfamily)
MIMEAIVQKQGEGRTYARPASHGAVTVKVAGEAATVFETARATGDAGGPGAHSHPGFDETFYVLSGEWEFTIGDRSVVADAGTVVHLPRGIFHSFHSTGRLDGRLLGVAVPGGIEEFFSEAELASGDVATGARHGITFSG